MTERRTTHGTATRRAPRIAIQRLHVRFSPGSTSMEQGRAVARRAVSIMTNSGQRQAGEREELAGHVAQAVQRALLAARRR